MTEQLHDVNTHIGIFTYIFSNSLQKSWKIAKSPIIRENPSFSPKLG
jgi:hypothetical protein